MSNEPKDQAGSGPKNRSRTEADRIASGIVIGLGILALWAAGREFLIVSREGGFVFAAIAVLLIVLGWSGLGLITIRVIILLIGGLMVIGSIASVMR